MSMSAGLTTRSLFDISETSMSQLSETGEYTNNDTNCYVEAKKDELESEVAHGDVSGPV